MQEFENTTRTRGLEIRYNLNATREPNICYCRSTVYSQQIRVFQVSLMYNNFASTRKKVHVTSNCSTCYGPLILLRGIKNGVSRLQFTYQVEKNIVICTIIYQSWWPSSVIALFFSFSFDWRVSFSTSFPKITRWQLKVMHLFPSGWQAHNHVWAEYHLQGKTHWVPRDYLWETIIFKVCELLPKGKEGGIYQMMMLKNCTHQYEYKVFCDP